MTSCNPSLEASFADFLGSLDTISRNYVTIGEVAPFFLNLLSIRGRYCLGLSQWLRHCLSVCLHRQTAACLRQTHMPLVRCRVCSFRRDLVQGPNQMAVAQKTGIPKWVALSGNMGTKTWGLLSDRLILSSQVPSRCAFDPRCPMSWNLRNFESGASFGRGSAGFVSYKSNCWVFDFFL